MLQIDTGERQADGRVHLLAQMALDDYFGRGGKPTFTNGGLRRVELGLKHVAKNRPKQLAWAIQSVFRVATHLYFDRNEKTEAYRLLRTIHPILPYVERANARALAMLEQQNQAGVA